MYATLHLTFGTHLDLLKFGLQSSYLRYYVKRMSEWELTLFNYPLQQYRNQSVHRPHACLARYSRPQSRILVSEHPKQAIWIEEAYQWSWQERKSRILVNKYNEDFMYKITLMIIPGRKFSKIIKEPQHTANSKPRVFSFLTLTDTRVNTMVIGLSLMLSIVSYFPIGKV